MNENAVMSVEHYDRVDGRNAYRSGVKKLTLGAPIIEENKVMGIAAQIWRESPDGKQELSVELPIHQVMDLMIFLGRTLVHFREAYRLPLLYNPQNPVIDRIGVQGDALQVAVCADNPNIQEDIKSFEQAISDLGELTGERMRILTRILEEME